MQTPYTLFCNHGQDLIKKTLQYTTTVVKPIMLSLRNEKGRSDVKRDVAIVTTYAMVESWMKSLSKLDKSEDIMAIGTGARCLLELYMDMKWFEKFPAPETAAKYNAFAQVDRYLVAERVVEHKNSDPNSKVDVAPYQKAMDAIDAKEPLDQLVSRVWGKKGDGTPDWPIYHWTGKRTLSSRAEILGSEAMDLYREVYPTLSWLVHGGPTAIYGNGFDKIEMQIGWGYLFGFQFARGATICAVRMLGIETKLEEFDVVMGKLWTYRDEALATLPQPA